MTEILNARITDTRIGELNGHLSAVILLDGDSWRCEYSGWCLDSWWASPQRHRSTGGYGAIIELMKAIDVESWEELKGKYVRAEFVDSRIERIGNITKDKWFSYEEYFTAVRDKEKNGNN